MTNELITLEKIAAKVQIVWKKDFEKEIEFVIGNEWKAGNLSYHLKSRPKWEGYRIMKF